MSPSTGLMTGDLRVAVVGLGFGAVHARVFDEMAGVRLTAVCDLDRERLAAVAKGRDVATYTDHIAMLRNEALDAVVVAVPTRLHAVVARAAIDAGKALLVEKPLAPSLAEGRELAKAAAAAGVPLMAGHIERFNPAVQALRARLSTGEAGLVLQITARRLGPFAARTRDVGVIHDLAFHDIDVMRHLLGAEVTRVSAETQTGIRTEYEDSVTGLLRFDSGAVGLLTANWLTPRKSRDLAVLCENGLYVADYVDYRAPTLDFYASDLSESAGAVSSIAVEVCEPLVSELSAFVAAVRDGAPMPVTSDDALGTLAVADALAESARTGKQVTLR